MFGIQGKQARILHLTWICFFLTFVAWFNMAPFNTTLKATLGISSEQINILMICNVALTIPARILIGSLVDFWGPRKVFSGLLIFTALVSLLFALSTQFWHLLVTRLLMSIVGAGFVVGIKMIGEWFPPEKMGTAQGVYGGWGNFGAAAATFCLPLIALPFSTDVGWRIATGALGLVCLAWAFVYFRFADDSPGHHQAIKKPAEKTLDVASFRDLILYIILVIPVYGSLILFVWKLSGHPLPLISSEVAWALGALVMVFFAIQVRKILAHNLPRLSQPISEDQRYEFSRILILSLVYALTFGSELAVISMFPEYLESMYHLSVASAGVLGSAFAVLNLFTRPSGGWLSDTFGRRRSLSLLILGAGVSFWLLSGIDGSFPLWGTVTLALIASVFIQSGNGACFSMVPLIRKDLTGRLAGMAGAYGNIGAVVFLTLLSFVEEPVFFKIISVYAFFVLGSLMFLKSFQQLHRSFGPDLVEGATADAKATR